MTNIIDAQDWKTVVADPPWRPAMSVINGGAPKASPQKHYETMKIPEIIALKPRLAPQSHLYLWCLAQHVDWGYEVARAWETTPIILLTWKKPGLGAGRFRCNSEHILVCRKGDRIGNPFGMGGRYRQATSGTVFEWPRGRHSEKPQEFFDLVETLSPGPRLEMYGRKLRPGWEVFGNEVNVVNG